MFFATLSPLIVDSDFWKRFDKFPAKGQHTNLLIHIQRDNWRVEKNREWQVCVNIQLSDEQQFLSMTTRGATATKTCVWMGDENDAQSRVW